MRICPGDLLVAHQVITDDAMVASITSRWDGAVAGGRVLVEVQPAMSCGTRPTTGRLSAGLMKSWTNQTPSSNLRPRMVFRLDKLDKDQRWKRAFLPAFLPTLTDGPSHGPSGTRR